MMTYDDAKTECFEWLWPAPTEVYLFCDREQRTVTRTRIDDNGELWVVYQTVDGGGATALKEWWRLLNTGRLGRIDWYYD